MKEFLIGLSLVILVVGYYGYVVVEIGHCNSHGGVVVSAPIGVVCLNKEALK